MNQPFWKRILSYLFEIHIESAPSEINPHLYVSLRKGRYQLATANAVYSYDDLYDNFVKTFRKMDLDGMKIQNVLILGFGLGSVPFILEKIFQKNYSYTAIEVDENVLYLANKYVLPQLESNISLICADAHAFVMQCDQQFDLIAMDVFIDDKVPQVFENESYLQKLKSLIAPKGRLLYNRLALTDSDKKETKSFYENHFLPVFPESVFLDVGGNWMLINRDI